MYDPVTELPLDELFRDRVNQAIRRRSRSPDEQFAVMLLELTGLNEIKRRGGNVSEVLLAIGRRVSVCVRPADTVARLGDRLGILLEGVDMLDDAVQVANRMLRDVGQPVPIEDTTTTLSGHMGLVLGRTSYDRADALLHDAQIALRSAASRGTPLHVFDFAAHENAEKFLRLEGRSAARPGARRVLPRVPTDRVAGQRTDHWSGGIHQVETPGARPDSARDVRAGGGVFPVHP